VAVPGQRVRYRLLTSELPEPEVQVPVFDRWGHEVAHADLGCSRWKVALEHEGRQHAERERFGRDIDRYSLTAADGWLTPIRGAAPRRAHDRGRAYPPGARQPRLATRLDYERAAADGGTANQVARPGPPRYRR
jgi:hypothetical protein